MQEARRLHPTIEFDFDVAIKVRSIQQLRMVSSSTYSKTVHSVGSTVHAVQSASLAVCACARFHRNAAQMRPIICLSHLHVLFLVADRIKVSPAVLIQDMDLSSRSLVLASTDQDSSPQRVSYDLLVAADGSSSQVRCRSHELRRNEPPLHHHRCVPTDLVRVLCRKGECTDARIMLVAVAAVIGRVLPRQCLNQPQPGISAFLHQCTSLTA